MYAEELNIIQLRFTNKTVKPILHLYLIFTTLLTLDFYAATVWTTLRSCSLLALLENYSSQTSANISLLELYIKTIFPKHVKVQSLKFIAGRDYFFIISIVICVCLMTLIELLTTRRVNIVTFGRNYTPTSL